VWRVRSAAFEIPKATTHRQPVKKTGFMGTVIAGRGNSVNALLALGDDLLAGAFEDGEEIFLDVAGDVQLVEGGFEVANGGIEFGFGNMHGRVEWLDGFAVVFGGAAGGEADELDEVEFEAVDVFGRGRPFGSIGGAEPGFLFHASAGPVDARVFEHALNEIVDDAANALGLAEALVKGDLFFDFLSGGGFLFVALFELFGFLFIFLFDR
jgi:hypothetical protein